MKVLLLQSASLVCAVTNSWDPGILSLALRGSHCDREGSGLASVECLFSALYPKNAGFGHQEETTSRRPDWPASSGDPVLDFMNSPTWRKSKALSHDKEFFRDSAAKQSTGNTAMVYGELLPLGVEQLLRDIPESIQHDDVFFDLGSGVGKVALQVFLTSVARRSVGVELDHARHSHALRALSSLRGFAQDLSGLSSRDAIDAFVPEFPGLSVKGLSVMDPREGSLTSAGRKLDLVQGDVLTADLSGATVFFACSLAFPDGLTHALAKRIAKTALPGTIAVFGRTLPGCHPGLAHLQTLNLPASWTKEAPMHIFLVTPETRLAPSMANGGILALDGLQVPELHVAVHGEVRGLTPEQNRRLSIGEPTRMALHREQGDLSSAVGCRALEFESLGAFNLSAANVSLDGCGLADRDSDGQQLLHLVVRKRLATLTGFRSKLHSGARDDLFAEHETVQLNRSLSLVQILLDRRADTRAADRFGHDALEIAREGEDLQMVKILETARQRYGNDIGRKEAQHQLVTGQSKEL